VILGYFNAKILGIPPLTRIKAILEGLKRGYQMGRELSIFLLSTLSYYDHNTADRASPFLQEVVLQSYFSIF